MAITRLKDLVTTFESKWTFGDSKFGYDGEVNESHNTQYPLLLINPPISTMPELYSGREEYEFEINFYNLYPQAAQSAVTLQHRWDNLQDLGMEWFDMVLKKYQDNTVDAYLNDESLEIERVKEVANDKLVQIKFTFTMSAFTKCFRPQSFYPSDYNNLISWFRADSGLTFDIPTKRISLWQDQSVEKNNLLQEALTKQALRFGYDGANDKAYVAFDGVNDLFTSLNVNYITTQFTIFQVSKTIAKSPADINGIYNYDDGTRKINITSTANNKLKCQVSDGTTVLSNELNNSVTTTDFIAMTQLSGKNLRLDYNALGSSASATVTDAAYAITTVYNEAQFKIGFASSKYLKGNIQEFIIYNSALNEDQINTVKSYLNTKFKIY